jgi:hypothetical protein
MVMVESLAPGKYEIFEIDESYMIGTISMSQWINVSLPFEIKSGTALYLGEFKAIGITKKNILGGSRPDGVRYVVSDQNARDLPIAKRKAQIPDNVVIAVPAGDELREASTSKR